MSLTPSISDPTIDPSTRFPDQGTLRADAGSGHSRFWGEDGPRFGDFLDTINPLQHIPGVSTVYRALTGDAISPGARIAGGGIFGGPLGFLSGLVNTMIENATGRDVGDHMLAMLPGRDPQPAGRQIAAAAATLGNQQSNEMAAARATGTRNDRADPVGGDAGGNLGALTALARDLRTAPPDRAQPVSANTDALAALRSDLAAARGNATNAAVAGPQSVPVRGPQPNLFAVALPPPASPEAGPTRPDGRKPGEYSAAELASILRSYQRAAAAAGPQSDVRTPRVEE